MSDISPQRVNSVNFFFMAQFLASQRRPWFPNTNFAPFTPFCTKEMPALLVISCEKDVKLCFDFRRRGFGKTYFCNGVLWKLTAARQLNIRSHEHFLCCFNDERLETGEWTTEKIRQVLRRSWVRILPGSLKGFFVVTSPVSKQPSIFTSFNHRCINATSSLINHFFVF